MLKRKYWFGLLWALTLLFFLPLAISARQSPAPPQDAAVKDDDFSKPAATLSVTLSESGRAHITLFVTAQTTSEAELKAAVEHALGCAIEIDSRFSRMKNGLAGFCDLRMGATRFRREGRILLAPLAAYARANNIENLMVLLELPDTETFDSQPAVKSPVFDRRKVSGKLRRLWDRKRIYNWPLDSPLPEAITFSFGYTQQSVSRAAWILALVLFAPVLFVFWLGRKALSARDADRSAVWFSYMRYLQWTLNGALIGWWIASESLRLVPLLKFISTGWLAAAWNFPVTGIIVDWMPPCLIWILCFALSHPVQQKLRGLQWTRREIVLQGAYSVSAALVPVALFLTGLQTLGSDGFQAGMLWFVAAFVVRLLAAAALLRLMGTLPQSLTTGDLRDHAFGMAQRLNVKLQQVYVIPAGKGQMANAFARTGNTVAFTDFLLQRMSRREVNYVLGHELTHLKLKHPGKIASLRVGSMVGAIFAVSFLMPFGLESPVLRYGIILAIVTLIPLFWSRRFEYAADAGAVASTGDPHAAISALFKLSSLNMMPLHWSKWSEKWLTHPSSLRRAQAIARKAGIPVEQIPEIARATVAEGDHYLLPPTVARGARVLSTQTRQKSSARATLAMLAAIIFVPAAFALLARNFAADPLLHLVLYSAGPVVALAVLLVASNFAPVTGLRELIVALKQKLQKENVQADAWGGIAVGFAPAAEPRIYELNSNWDIGSLFIRSDRLCYCGEETKFALRREQVTAIALGPGLPGLWRTRRVYIAWKDAEIGRSGAFNFGCIQGRSMLELRRKTAELEKLLQNWWKASAESRPLPPQLAELNPPFIGAVTGTSPQAHWTFRRVFKELLLTGILASIAAVFCGLPFHLLAYLLSAPLSAMKTPLYVHSPGAGWYVVAVAVILRAAGLLPFLGYKEKPCVEVPLLQGGQSSARDVTQSSKKETPETVIVR